MEVVEVVLVQCNLLDTQYQKSDVVYTFTLLHQIGLINIYIYIYIYEISKLLSASNCVTRSGSK